MAKDTKQFIGKTLKEVKEMVETVRVMGAGPVRMVGTMNYDTSRLNVVLGEEGLEFETFNVTLAGVEFERKRVVGSMDNGVVVSAYWG